MVVTQSLHDLFNLDMRGYPVAAVQDSVLAHIEWKHPIDLHTTPYFNSGMLLADLVQWREHNIAAQLLKTAASLNEAVPYGDQCFLNTVFQKKLAAIRRILELPNRRSRIFPKTKPRRSIPKPDTVPPIIHYTTRAKPWLCDYGKIPFEEIYCRLAGSVVPDREYPSLASIDLKTTHHQKQKAV